MEHHASQGFSLLDTLVTFSPTGTQPEKKAAGSPLSSSQFLIIAFQKLSERVLINPEIEAE